MGLPVSHSHRHSLSNANSLPLVFSSSLPFPSFPSFHALRLLASPWTSNQAQTKLNSIQFNATLLFITDPSTIRPRRITPATTPIPIGIERQLQLCRAMYASTPIESTRGGGHGRRRAHTRHIRRGVRRRLAIEVGVVVVIVVVVCC